MGISSFDQIRDKALSASPVVIAVAAAEDVEVLLGAAAAVRQQLISSAILTGDREHINALLKQHDIPVAGFRLVQADSPAQAAALAVAAIRDGEADILVKGALDSSLYFRAILHPETGLRSSGLLSSATVFQLPSYHKLLTLTDNAIVLQPNLQQKQRIIENTQALFEGLEIAVPRVAIVAAAEKPNPKMSATTDAVSLTRLNREGAMAGFMVDGPFGYDACISRQAAISKGLTESQVAGYPDLLLMPDLEAANILGKAYKYHGNADSGGLVLGASAPVVINSRSDDARRRLNSLMLARVVLAGNRSDTGLTTATDHQESDAVPSLQPS